MPAQRISEIVSGGRAITADTDLRLRRFFGLPDGYWLRAQAATTPRSPRRRSRRRSRRPGPGRIPPPSLRWAFLIGRVFSTLSAQHHGMGVRTGRFTRRARAWSQA